MFPASTVCPRCKCGACYPLHRKGVDWVISLFGLRPARCLTCTRKFYTRYTLNNQIAPANRAQRVTEALHDRQAESREQSKVA